MLALPSFHTAPSSASTGSGVSVDISSDEDEGAPTASSAGSLKSERPSKKAKPESPSSHPASPPTALQARPVEPAAENPAWKTREQIQDLFPGDTQTVDLLVERKVAEQQVKDVVVEGRATRLYWVPYVGRAPPTASKSRSPPVQAAKVETKAAAAPPAQPLKVETGAPAVTFAGASPARPLAKPVLGSPPPKSIMRKGTSSRSLEETQVDPPSPVLYAPATKAEVQNFFAAHPGAMTEQASTAIGCYAKIAPSTPPKKMHGRPVPTPSRAPGLTGSKQEVKTELPMAAPAVSSDSSAPATPEASVVTTLALPKGPSLEIPASPAESHASALPKGPSPVIPASAAESHALALRKGASPVIPASAAESHALALPKGPPVLAPASVLQLPKVPPAKVPAVAAPLHALPGPSCSTAPAKPKAPIAAPPAKAEPANRGFPAHSITPGATCFQCPCLFIASYMRICNYPRSLSPQPQPL